MTPEQKLHLKRRRRAAFRHRLLTAAPIRLSGGRLCRPRPGRDFALTGAAVELPALPDDLAGLTIAHLSDPHVGDLLTPEHLPAIVAAVESLKPDLIAVTGDFVDFDNRYLPPIVQAMSRLRAPLGSYFVLGNHDYLDNADAVKRAFADAGLNLLLNEARHVEHAGRRIAIGGVDWSYHPHDLDRSVHTAVKAMDPDSADLNILLAHHPHAYDTARLLGVDLTLSGHTHGGQFLLSSKRGRKGSIGLANLGFRYTKGHYQNQGRHLYVTTGVGSWFPLRFRCPAEIARLELAKAK